MKDDRNFNIQNFYSLIADNTKDFSGRNWLFTQIKEWLSDPNGLRYLLITGKAGTGKSTIAARLWEISEGLIKDPHLEKELSAIYVCSAREDESINPISFSKSLSKQLVKRDIDFAKELIENSKGDEFKKITISSNIKNSTANQINGIIINIKEINVYGVSPIILFSTIFREPLEYVLNKNPNKKFVLLIDALD